jgi:hypothetical protein
MLKKAGNRLLSRATQKCDRDTRLGWKASEFLELSIAGQNLLTPRHFEMLDGVQIRPTQVQRSVVAKLSWRF